MRKTILGRVISICVAIGILCYSAFYPIGPDTFEWFSFGRYQMLGHYPPPILYDVEKHIEIDSVKAYQHKSFKLYVKGDVGFTVVNLITRKIEQVVINPTRFGPGWATRMKQAYGEKYQRLNFEELSPPDRAIFNAL